MGVALKSYSKIKKLSLSAASKPSTQLYGHEIWALTAALSLQSLTLLRQYRCEKFLSTKGIFMTNVQRKIHSYHNSLRP